MYFTASSLSGWSPIRRMEGELEDAPATSAYANCRVMRAIAILAALVFVAGCAGGDDETAGDQIAFTVNRAGWNEIWLMAADGTERARLTELEPPQNDAAGNGDPAWSPDGSQIAFAGQIGTTTEDPRRTEIYVMRVDGTGRRRLTTNDALDGNPAWSPDGKRIAFARVSEFGTEQARGGLFVMDADGGNERQITTATAPSFDVAPAWSPDGSQIAFVRVASGAGSEQPRASLHVVARDGGAVRDLAQEGSEPVWSPDGKRVAFVSYRDRFGRTCFHECSTSGEIYVLEVETGETRRLTRSQASDGSPAWSPDGRRIAFVSDRSNRQQHAYEIYVMGPSGEDVVRITRNAVWDLEPVWRP